MTSHPLTRGIVAAALLLGAAGAALVAQDAAAGPERFSATVMSPTGRGSFALSIAIDRWSTDDERKLLVSSLMDKGGDQALKVVRGLPHIGYVRSAATPEWELRYARRVLLPDGGERVVLATERPLAFWEQAGNQKAVDYPFTIVELRLNAKGDGEGSVSLATKIAIDKDSGAITLETNGRQAVPLQSVKREQASD